MIDALIAGKLHGAPQSRTGASGKPFVTAKVRAPAGDGEAVFVNVIAFSESTGAALLALGDGDSVALAGALTPKAWVTREGEARPALDMVAHAVLTAYEVKRKRAAVQATRQPPQRQPARPPMDGAEQARLRYGPATGETDGWA